MNNSSNLKQSTIMDGIYLTIDHIKPRYISGTNDFCNVKKGVKHNALLPS